MVLVAAMVTVHLKSVLSFIGAFTRTHERISDVLSVLKFNVKLKPVKSNFSN